MRTTLQPYPNPLTHRSLRLLVPVALVCLSAWAAGCGGRTLESLSDGGSSSSTEPVDEDSADSGSSTSSSSSSGSAGSSGGTAFPICPDLAPHAGWSCSSPNLGCAYVNYDTGACTSFVCDSTGHWASSTPAGC